MKGGYVLISKSKVFFKSVQGKFEEISEKIWAGFPRALPPGISIGKYDGKFWEKTSFLLHYIRLIDEYLLIFRIRYTFEID